MEDYIKKENIALLKKRLAETLTEAERHILMKLLADEQAKEHRPPAKKS